MKRHQTWQDKLATSQKNVFHGSLDGRLKSASPVRSSGMGGSDYEEDLGDEEQEKVLFNQELFPVSHSGLQTLRLLYVPQDYSEHIYWLPSGLLGIYQEQVQWSRVGNVITFNDQDNLLLIGDVLLVEYAYLESDVIEDAAPIGSEASVYVYSNYGAENTSSKDANAQIYIDVIRSLPAPVPDSVGYVYVNIQ